MVDPYIIGIDIGTSSLKIALLRIAQTTSLSFYSIIDISKNSSDAYIIESIKKSVKDNKVAARSAVLVFTDESITIRRMQLPHMSHNEIIDAVKWQVKDTIHFDIDKASLDFEVLGDIQKEDGSKFMDILAVIVSKDAIDKKVSLLKEAGLDVISINASPFGLENMIKVHEESSPSGTVMVVDFGNTKTEVSVFRNRALGFARTIPVGSGNISEVMATSLMTDAGAITLSREDAETIKARIGIPYEDIVLEKGIKSIQVLSLMRPVLERLSKEIKRSIDYYAQEYGGEDIKSVYITGGGSALKNLDRYLSEELGCSVRRLGLPGVIDASKADIRNDDALSLVSLVGAISGYKGRPNLLPYEYRAERIEFIEKISLRMFAVFMGLVLLVSFLFIKLQINDYSTRLRHAALQKNILLQIKDLRDRVVEREAFLNQVKPSIPIEYLMKELSHIVPKNIVLNSLNVDLRGKVMNMEGAVYGPRGSAEEALTKFMEALEKSKYFRDAQLISVQGSGIDRAEGANFEITCSMD